MTFQTFFRADYKLFGLAALLLVFSYFSLRNAQTLPLTVATTLVLENKLLHFSPLVTICLIFSYEFPIKLANDAPYAYPLVA